MPRTRPTVGRYLDTATPEALFVLSALSQYIGASIAVTLFDRVEPQTVAWFRVMGATIALLAISPGFHRGWTRRQLLGAAVFGIATALMNLFFYLAIARIDLGKSVAIEFIGPIVVAAVMTRTPRNAVALLVAVTGVVTLGGVEIGENTLGLVFILLASAMWAAYIVVGSRVAQLGRGVTGLGVGLAIGTVAIAPIGAPWSGPVWVSPTLLVLCLLTGVFSNAIGYGIDQYVMRRIPIRRFSLLLALLPVTAVFVGWLALDQTPSRLDLAGIGLVLVGVALQEREQIVGVPEPG
ncbi:MAG: EamA family transporter [Ilumatobacter sp.]|nr:MAG: EamA family transporter [Ilumatobacter sp.]